MSGAPPALLRPVTHLGLKLQVWPSAVAKHKLEPESPSLCLECDVRQVPLTSLPVRFLLCNVSIMTMSATVRLW